MPSWQYNRVFRLLCNLAPSQYVPELIRDFVLNRLEESIQACVGTFDDILCKKLGSKVLLVLYVIRK
jgi:hypothetical protein